MMFRRHIAAAAALVLLASCGSSSDERNVDQVVSFGDSLSDLGTYQVPAVTAAGGGRFTTNQARLWIEYIADHYGVSISRNRNGGFGTAITVQGGTAYGEGGSRVTLQPGIGCTSDGMGGCTLAAAQSRPVNDQINAYLAANGGAANPKAVFLVFAGANDAFFQAAVVAGAGGTPTAQAAAVTAMGLAGTELSNYVKRLTAAGAKKVVVITLPDLGSTPGAVASGASAQALLAGLSLTFNGALSNGLSGAVGVTVVPSVDFFNDARSNPARYGFVNTTGTACNLAVLPNQSSLFCSAATLNAVNAQNNYLFADGVHPTAGAHQQFAQYVIERIKVVISN